MIVLMSKYSERITHSAEEFMVSAFQNGNNSNELNPVLIEAAMNIINGMAFYQPLNCENCNEKQPDN